MFSPWFKKNDNFWTTPISFVSSANCALHCGANVKFIDIDRANFNISLKLLDKKLSEIKKKTKLPKIVMPVHLSGNPVDLLNLVDYQKNINLKLSKTLLMPLDLK